jgi:propionyl-CoA carboxylase alpha chain
MFQANTTDLYGVRVDTGVQDGGEIPMYYDSMIAKLIVHGRTRNEAIVRMREALNAFVIRGISSNIPFQAALLAHPKFVAGDFNTGFIAENWPEGFRAEDVPHEDPDFLVAMAAGAYRRYLDRAAGISGQLEGHGVRIGRDFVAAIRGKDGRHRFVPVRIEVEGATRVEIGGREYALKASWHFGGIRAHGTCNGKPFTAQLERHGQWIRIEHNGLRIDVQLMTARATGPLQVPAVTDAGPAGRHRGEAGAARAGRRTVGGDRGDEDGERVVCHG